MNREIRRRTDVVLVTGIFPNRDAITRLIGAVLLEQAEQHDEWAEQRRYLGVDLMARSQVVLEPKESEEALTATIAARSVSNPRSRRDCDRRTPPQRA